MPVTPHDIPILPGEQAETYRRLGSVEGKIDALLQLRREDGDSLKELSRDIRATVTGIHEAVQQAGGHVTELSADVRTLKDGLAAISRIVRDGDNNSLVHRVTKIEEVVQNLRNTVDGDRLLLTAEMAGFRDGVEGDLKDLRAELNGFSRDLRGELQGFARATAAEREQAARALVDRDAEAIKERRAHNRNLVLTVLGGLVGLAVAAIQGAFSNHWK